MAIVRSVEGSTIVVRLTFRDRDDALVAPDSVEWALVDAATNDVLRAMAAASESPAAEMDIAIDGDLVGTVPNPYRLVRVEVRATLPGGDIATEYLPVRVMPLGSI